jgi:hypothetical protein
LGRPTHRREAHYGSAGGGTWGTCRRRRCGHARQCWRRPTRRRRSPRGHTGNQRRPTPCTGRRCSGSCRPGPRPGRRPAGPCRRARRRAALDGELAVAFVLFERGHLVCDNAVLERRPRGSRGCSPRRRLGDRGGSRSRRSQQGRAHAVEQRLAVEWLEQMTVGTDPTPARFVERVLAGRQDVYRHAAQRWIGLQRRAQIIAIARS